MYAWYFLIRLTIFGVRWKSQIHKWTSGTFSECWSFMMGKLDTFKTE